jgi:cell division protein FtsI (penicillin-binding protein 3)
MDVKKHIYWKVYLLYFLFLGAMLAVVVKTFNIQASGRDNILSEQTDRIQIVQDSVDARRGQILDDHGEPLVTSVSLYEIRMDPTVVDQKLFNRALDSLCNDLSTLFKDKSAREYREMIQRARVKGNRYLLIQRKVTNEKRKALKTMPIFKLMRNKSGLIDNIEIIERKRPYGALAHRTLGYVKKDIRVGLEAAYNDVLAGEPGIELRQKMATGSKPTGKMLRETIDGSDIVTTINKDILEVAHASLLHQLELENAQFGTCLVMEVETGHVKAIVNLSRSESGKYFENYNFAAGRKVYPGSTMKLATLLAMLEDGKADITDSVNAVGKYVFWDAELNDDGGGRGNITLQQAFEYSSNIIAKLAYHAYSGNPMDFIRKLESFGLTDTLGIDILGEPIPTVYKPGDASWSRISLPWMSIGYEIQITPLQLLTFYNGVANNGTVMRPQFVKEIRQDGAVKKTFEPVILRDKIASPENIQKVKLCMEGVVERGTGRQLKSASFKIAGKTGTSRLDKGRTSKGAPKHQALFVGYFPAEKPLYSCLVLVNDPQVNYSGSTVSGTVFATIANKVYSTHLEYQKKFNASTTKKKDAPAVMNGSADDIKTVLNRLNILMRGVSSGNWLVTNRLEQVVQLDNRKIEKGLVPNTIGMGLKDAIYLLENEGLYVEFKGKGRVVSQSIEANKTAVRGSLIKLELR